MQTDPCNSTAAATDFLGEAAASLRGEDGESGAQIPLPKKSQVRRVRTRSRSRRASETADTAALETPSRHSLNAREARRMPIQSGSPSAPQTERCKHYDDDDDEPSYSGNGEDTDSDDMDEEDCHMKEESYSAADKTVDYDHELSGSESEDIDEEKDQDCDHTLQMQESASNCSSNSRSRHNTSKTCHAGSKSSRKRKYRERDCSPGNQYAAEVKRLKESKLKHNKNEQLRRKDMKEAVHKLRNQLRRKTKKPSTISVLKAAKQEIDELTVIKTEEDKELERLRQKELFLKYQLESLISDRSKLLSSGATSVIVSPVRAGMVRAPSFVHPSTSAAVAARSPITIPQSVHSRPSLPQFSLFPLVPPSVPQNNSAANSPTTVGRVGILDCSPQVGGHPSIIAPPGLTSISRLPLPQPPSLIPFNPTPPRTVATARASSANLSSTPQQLPTSSRSPASLSLFPTVTPTLLPGVSPSLHLMTPPPRSSTAQQSSPGMHLYTRGFPSPFIMQYPAAAAAVGRLPSTITTAQAAVLTPPHPPSHYPHHPHHQHTAGNVARGRISMTPTFPLPFGYLPTSLHPSPPIGTNLVAPAGLGTQFSCTGAQPAHESSSVRHLQFVRSADSSQMHLNTASRQTSVGSEKSSQRTLMRNRHDSVSDDQTIGSKNDRVSAEAKDYHSHSPYSDSGNYRSGASRKASADIHKVLFEENLRSKSVRRDHDASRCSPGAKHNDRDDCGCVVEDDGFSNAKIPEEKAQRVYHRYSRNSVISVSRNASKSLFPTAPPLLKVIDVEEHEDDNDTHRNSETWGKDQDQSRGELYELHVGRKHLQRGSNHLAAVPRLRRNPDVISTPIKRLQPQRETTVHQQDHDHEDKDEDCYRNRDEHDYLYRKGDQRWRVSNSLSSSDEGPDSPQQMFSNGCGQLPYSYSNKLSLREGHYGSSQAAPAAGGRRESVVGTALHKNLHYKNIRSMKSNGLQRHGNHNINLLQSAS